MQNLTIFKPRKNRSVLALWQSLEVKNFPQNTFCHHLQKHRSGCKASRMSGKNNKEPNAKLKELVKLGIFWTRAIFLI